MLWLKLFDKYYLSINITHFKNASSKSAFTFFFVFLAKVLCFFSVL